MSFRHHESGKNQRTLGGSVASNMFSSSFVIRPAETRCLNMGNRLRMGFEISRQQSAVERITYLHKKSNVTTNDLLTTCRWCVELRCEPFSTYTGEFTYN